MLSSFSISLLVKQLWGRTLVSICMVLRPNTFKQQLIQFISKDFQYNVELLNLHIMQYIFHFCCITGMATRLCRSILKRIYCELADVTVPKRSWVLHPSSASKSSKITDGDSSEKLYRLRIVDRDDENGQVKVKLVLVMELKWRKEVARWYYRTKWFIKLRRNSLYISSNCGSVWMLQRFPILYVQRIRALDQVNVARKKERRSSVYHSNAFW